MPGVKGQASGGHNAKPTQLHDLAGTRRKDRHSHSSPDAPKGRPDPPKALSGEALEEWDRMCHRLELTGAISTVDDGVMYQCCKAFADTEEMAREKVATRELIDRMQDRDLSCLEGGQLVAFVQAVTKLRQLEASYSDKILKGRMAQRVFLVEFGLTPASRGRVKLPGQNQDADPFDEFDVH